MIPTSVRIYVYMEPVDMRRGFDGLAPIARDAMAQDPRPAFWRALHFRQSADRPTEGALVGSQRLLLLYKRAHRAVFELPSRDDPSSVSVRIDGKLLAQLLAGATKIRKPRAKLRVVR